MLHTWMGKNTLISMKEQVRYAQMVMCDHIQMYRKSNITNHVVRQ